MAIFLQDTAADLYARLGDGISRCVIVFPNKRPESYFLQALAEAVPHPVAAPRCMSVEEFVFAYSGQQPADPLQLLFQLFGTYQEFVPDEEFDNFYGWGNLLLKDYDDIDRYMVDPAPFFSNLSAIKEIEEDFMPMDEEAYQPLPWTRISPTEPHYLKKRFIKLWDIFSRVYYKFREQLAGQNLAYSGMCYRMLAEDLHTGKLTLPDEKYVFVGFNALSRAEEIIIQHLIDREQALVYWDADKYFLDKPWMEAGFFLRKGLDRLEGYNPQVFSSSLERDAREIHIVGVPMKVGQAKAMGIELKQFLQSHSADNAALVLPDENLLLPALHALPPQAGRPNVTAGYPLQFSALFTFFETLILLQENYLRETDSFHYKDVIALLSHPYLREQDSSAILGLVTELERNRLIYVERDSLVNDGLPILQRLFRPAGSAQAIMTYFREILDHLRKVIIPRTAEEKAAFENFSQLLGHLGHFLPLQDVRLSRGSFLRLFREAVVQRRIPLESERTQGLQVMGTLETRCLSFDTVFMLSVNEGVMPGSKKNHSYIPYDLRQASGLPTSDEQEALYAYYFYRLLSGARRVFLFYNSETGSRGEEKSRFLRQVEQYLQHDNPHVKLHRRHYALPMRNTPPQPVSVTKDEAYYAGIQAKNEKDGISPSFLSTYFVCPLKFLLNHIIRLRAPEGITEDLEANEFGTLFHGMMEEAYKDYIGQEVRPEDIERKLKSLDVLLERTLRLQARGRHTHFLSRNSLKLETLKVLAEKALQADMEYAPFTYLGSEIKLTRDFHLGHPRFPVIRLQGTIDRLDIKDGKVRIVDYKTGHVDKPVFNFTDPEEELVYKNKEAFQALYYAWLYGTTNGAAELIPTLLPLRKVAEGYKPVNERGPYLQPDTIEQFEEKLRQVILTVLDEEQPIAQTDDPHICGFCDYVNICLR